MTIINVLDTNELKSFLLKFKAENNKFPRYDSGPIMGTDDTWMAIDLRLRKSERRRSLAETILDLVKIRRVDVANQNELLAHIEAFKKDHGVYPIVTSGDVKDTDDNWQAIDMRLRTQMNRDSLSKFKIRVLGNLQVYDGTKVDVTDRKALHALMIAFRDAHPEKKFPNSLSGSIEGTNDNWSSVNQRLNHYRINSSLAAEGRLITGKVKATSQQHIKIVKHFKKINVSNSIDLHAHMEAYKQANPDKGYPGPLSGPIRRMNDTWADVAYRLNYLSPASTLSMEAKKIKAKTEGILNLEVCSKLEIDSPILRARRRI